MNVCSRAAKLDFARHFGISSGIARARTDGSSFEFRRSSSLKCWSARAMLPGMSRATANRLNAARSTGPRTPEGKARSKQNSRKHGLSAHLDFADEDPKRFREIVHAIRLSDDRLAADAEQIALALLQSAQVNGVEDQLHRDFDTAICSCAEADRETALQKLLMHARYQQRSRSHLKRLLRAATEPS